MKQYWLRLFPEQPLALENDSILPAAMLRGAIASLAASTCIPGYQHDTGPCSATCRYWSLFGEGATLRLGPAYAGTADETEPYLATARTCTVHPGFKATGGHGVFDIAIRQLAFEQADPQRISAPFSAQCPACGAALQVCEGLITRHGDGDFSAVGDISSPVSSLHTSWSRRRKRITGQYSISGRQINRNIHYTARLDISERLDPELRDLLVRGLWIGAHRSRGMGAMRAELVERPPEEITLRDRLARFNRAVRAEYRFYSAMDSHYGPDDGDWYFTLDLRNVALTAYDSGPSIVPRLPTLPGVILARHWLSPQRVSGWHVAAGVPRRLQIGITGVILYRVPADINRQEVEEALAIIEQSGIGTGRERGYGALRICDPFHLHVEPL